MTVGKEGSEYLFALQELQMKLLDYGKKFRSSIRCIIAVRTVVGEILNKHKIAKVVQFNFNSFVKIKYLQIL